MSRARKLMVVVTAVPLLLGALAVFTPAEAKHIGIPPCDSAACDPYCRHWCPDGKKVGGQTCVFAGCVPTTGECTYACAQ